jgi:ribosomal protein L3 glutamine methyltransferase
MKTAANWHSHCTAKMKSAGLYFGHGTDNASDEAAWLILHVLDAPLDGSFEQWDIVPDQGQQNLLEQLLARRIKQRCPLAYLIGEARFCGLMFFVTPNVLVPRSPVAELIAGQFSPWLMRGKEGRVLDMCTGGACIAIATALNLPGVQVDAVDLSEAALEVAARNVERHALSKRVNLIQSDLFTELGNTRYELIVSNPPYVSARDFATMPAEFHAEPAVGLVSGTDGLDIVLRILDAACRHLAEDGILVVEVGASAGALVDLLPRVSFLWLEFRHGGDGVFLLEYDQLLASNADVRALLEQRKYV